MCINLLLFHILKNSLMPNLTHTLLVWRCSLVLQIDNSEQQASKQKRFNDAYYTQLNA